MRLPRTRASPNFAFLQDFMWANLALFIIRFRRSLIAVLAVITVFMSFFFNYVEMTY